MFVAHLNQSCRTGLSICKAVWLFQDHAFFPFPKLDGFESSHSTVAEVIYMFQQYCKLQASNLQFSPQGINAPQWFQITLHSVKRAMWLTLLKTPTFGKDLHLNLRHAESQADTSYWCIILSIWMWKVFSKLFPVIQSNVLESVKSYSTSLLQQVLVIKPRKTGGNLLT